MNGSWMKLMVPVLFVSAVIPLLLYLVLDPLPGSGSADPSKPPIEAASPEAAEMKALAAAIDDLKKSIDRLQGSLALTEPAPSEWDAALAGERVALEPARPSRLEEKLEELTAAVKLLAASSGGRASLRLGGQDLGETPEDARTGWNSSKAAEDELFLLSYAQVLEKLGRPHYIRSMNGIIYWDYKGMSVKFMDGLVAEVTNWMR